MEVDFDRYDRLSNFKRVLYPHQKDAVKFLLTRKKCILADGQGVGKTTLMNAILYPFVVEDRFIDIDRLEKQRFSLYYFPSERNSFVIYEVVNNLGVPYCILIHRSGAIL